MNKLSITSFTKETIYYLTAFFPLAFSMAVCFDWREIIGTLFACLAILLAPAKNEKIMPVYLSFMILRYAIVSFGGIIAFWACIVCGIMLIISSFFADKLKTTVTSPAVSGTMLATALTVTVLFTTHYFGIGAKGNTVMDMIDSYISLGFHPNWRGVLYGTIVMVIMITFPRKFKKLTKTVSAPFIAIVATLILNLFLNPTDMATAINEIHDGTKSDAYFYLLSSKAAFYELLDFKDIIAVVLIGTALFVTCFYAISSNEKAEKKDYIIGGVANGICGGIFRFPFPYGINKDKSNILPRITAAGIMFLLFYFGEEIMLRIPIHSCAVVVIVGAWQSVKWNELKKVFNGIVPIACFTVCLILFLLTDLVSGVLISFLISAFYNVFSDNSKVFKKC